LLFLETCFGSLFYLELCGGYGIQSCLATGNFRRQIHAVRHRGLVSLRCQRQQGFDFRFELDFQLLNVAV
jgi:hypothetical protein